MKPFLPTILPAVLLAFSAESAAAAPVTAKPFGKLPDGRPVTLYTLAGANLFHLALTAFLGLAMWNRGRLHIYSAESNWQVRLVGVWWTWIAVAAVLAALTTSFITSPNVGG